MLDRVKLNPLPGRRWMQGSVYAASQGDIAIGLANASEKAVTGWPSNITIIGMFSGGHLGF